MRLMNQGSAPNGLSGALIKVQSFSAVLSRPGLSICGCLTEVRVPPIDHLGEYWGTMVLARGTDQNPRAEFDSPGCRGSRGAP